MTYGDFIVEMAHANGWAVEWTYKTFGSMTAFLTKAVLDGSGKVVVPGLGTFHRCLTKKSRRKVGAQHIDVPASYHVRFRASKGARKRAK